MRRLLLAVTFIAFSFSFVLPAFAQSDQVVANGHFTTAVNFSGLGCTYNWVNDNPAIGLPASGTGYIGSFIGINNGTVPIMGTITAKPAVGGFAYITNESDGTISVINVSNNQVISTIPIASNAGPWGAAISPDGKYAYIADANIGTISVINTATNTVIKTFPSALPYSLCVSPDGSRLYVANYSTNSVSVINTSTYAVIKTIAVGKSPSSIAISPNGSTVYVTNSASSTISVINIAANTVSTTITSPVLNIEDVAVSPDGNNMYFTAQQYVYVVNTATNNITNKITVNAAYGIVVSPDSKHIYVANAGTNNVSVIDAVNQSVVATIPVGNQPEGVSLNADGSILMVTNYRSNTVSVINTVTNSVTNTIPVGAFPLSLGNFIAPDPSGCTGSTITFTITVNPSSTTVPALTASAATGSITSCVGTASTSPNIQQFTVSGSNLTSAITATAPTGFEVSLTAATGYASSVTLNQSSGSLSSTTVYVRSATGDAVGPISGNVALSSPGAANQNVAVLGTVNALPTVNTITNQTLLNGAATTAINFTGTGNTAFTWVNNTPGVGLPATGSGNIGSFTAVNNGNTPITATITATPVSEGFAYIANSGDGTISVINVATNTIVSTIMPPHDPFCVCISPDGSKAYIGCSDGSSTVTIINTTTNAIISTIPVSSSGESTGIVVSPDGTTLYVANYVTGTVSVVNIATSTVVAVIQVGSNPYGIAISPDGSKVYVAFTYTSNISVIDTKTNNISANLILGSVPDIAVSPNGNIYVPISNLNNVSVLNPITNSVIAVIPVSASPGVIALSPDGTRAYVATGQSNVSVINTSTNTVLSLISVGSNPEAICVSPDGYFVYVTNATSNNVSVINTSTNVVIATVKVGTSPISLGNFVTAGSGCPGIPTTFTITVNPLSIPTITASTVTGNITGCEGTASSDVRQFTVSGSGLTGDITATAPLNFEISLNATTGFSNSLTLTQINGTVSNTIIYVRAAATAPAGSISGNVDLTSAGATNQAVVVSYTINAIPSVDAVVGQTLTNGATTSPVNFSGTAATYNWINDSPGIGLAANGTGNIPSFTSVNNTNNPITATITVTPLNGTSCSGTPIIFTITVNPPAPSTLTATANLSPLATIYGTPSSAESFTLSGTNITGGITITISPGFEVSNNGSTYNSTTTINGNGTITSAPVYIRLAATTPVGSYTGGILIGTNSANNVNVLIPLSTVSPAPLIITANNTTKPFGAINPPLTVTYSGFVNNDGPAQLTSKPVVTTTALTQSPLGQYPITISDAVSPNYTFTYISGILTIEPSLSALSIPNTFTPNGDGINDTWEIKYLDYYPKSTVNIFNRWGQKVFSSIGYPTPWDGTYKGTVLPSGTYYYIIDPKNGQAVFSGWLAIIR
ncbi:gliding motility-associated C-terminal domain-containing protein [Mucilaginibacter sp. L196]|uniref:YVTN family beta-propeller repeat protein n=1 Tax=Mucilaginibacter sp. L196 TaxID=1641870 RepID=UPI00131CC4C4|nr:gliding motility-associated C-terminal domain-containing protein [Mucilaginibacter sp. L196]